MATITRTVSICLLCLCLSCCSKPGVDGGKTPTSRSAWPEGMIEQGNIDLTNRPVVQNADGTVSTVRSISVEIDGQEILIPTVSDDGRIMSNEDAVQQYKRTGRHLGKFSSVKAATKYAIQIHEEQERLDLARTFMHGGTIVVDGNAVPVDGAIPLLEQELAAWIGDGVIHTPRMCDTALYWGGGIENIIS